MTEIERAIDLLDNLMGMIEDNQGNDYDFALKKGIEALQKEPCDDCVSRQVVKEQMLKYGFHALDMTVTEFVEDLPPVLPKQNIVNCENFKFDEWDIEDKKAELWVVKGKLQIRHRGTIHNVDFPVTPKREQGEWIEIHPLQEDDGGAFMCSKCRCGHPYIAPHWKYCPNCGAKMESEDKK